MRTLTLLILWGWLTAGLAACLSRPTLESTPTHQVQAAIITTVALSEPPRHLVWSPDGQELALLGTQAQTVEPVTGQTQERFPAVGVQTLTYTPDGRLIAFSVTSSRAQLIDLRQEALLTTLTLDPGAFYTHLARFAPAADRLALPDNRNNITLWEVADGARRAVLAEHDASLTALAWSPDGQLIASGDQSGNVYIWDWAAGVALVSHRRGGRAVSSLTFSPQGDLVAVHHANGELWLVDTLSGTRLVGLEGGGWSQSRLAFAPDGQWLAAPGPTGPVLLWGVAGGDLLTILDDEVPFSQVYPSLITAFDPAGGRLAVGAVHASTSPRLTIWSLSTR